MTKEENKISKYLAYSTGAEVADDKVLHLWEPLDRDRQEALVKAVQ